MGSFYDTPKQGPERERLAKELHDAKDQLAENDSRKSSTEEQLVQMEKSFQMASKYLPGVANTTDTKEIYLKELENESTKVVQMIMKSIYKSNQRKIKHIGCKRFGIQHTLKGIYAN